MTDPAQINDAYRTLTEAGVHVDAAQVDAARAQAAAPPPERRCTRCGATDDDNAEAGYGTLIAVTVRVAPGEEGTAEEERLLCDTHLLVLTDLLDCFGFSSHRHGGINYLENLTCPGLRNPDDCPTPETRD